MLTDLHDEGRRLGRQEAERDAACWIVAILESLGVDRVTVSNAAIVQADGSRLLVMDSVPERTFCLR